MPSIVSHLVGRSEFSTAYTPYQPEISQGTLQSGFEFQSVVCELTGMDVANVGLYDVASATAEACLMASRTTKRQAVCLLEPIHPGTAGVVKTYARGAGLRVDAVSTTDELSDEHACLVVQQPDFLGTIVDLERLANAAHEVGALLVVVADPFALGMLKAPGDAGADIVTGEGRDLAGAPAFGGPSLGLFAAGLPYLRQMPGRIVGRTKELSSPDDGEPRTGYVLTLQAREQFIRRERATSNVSTAQALIALGFHDRRAGAWSAGAARVGGTVLPARARRRAPNLRAARLRRAGAWSLVPGVPRTRSDFCARTERRPVGARNHGRA